MSEEKELTYDFILNLARKLQYPAERVKFIVSLNNRQIEASPEWIFHHAEELKEVGATIYKIDLIEMEKFYERIFDRKK